MMVSTKGRYGLRALLVLALNYEKGPVSMNLITSNQGLSRKYIHTLLTMLKNAGIVDCTRGVKGGYYLAKSPEQVNLYDIIKALEGDVSFIGSGEYKVDCKLTKECRVKEVWKNLDADLEGMFKKVTLTDFL
jgi:Rrf2 family protein